MHVPISVSSHVHKACRMCGNPLRGRKYGEIKPSIKRKKVYKTLLSIPLSGDPTDFSVIVINEFTSPKFVDCGKGFFVSCLGGVSV